MNTSLQIKTLTRDDILTHLDALADILENCVRGGASVSFMLPFSTDKARAFWQDIAGSVERNERVVLACIDSQDGVIGTVQLITGIGHGVGSTVSGGKRSNFCRTISRKADWHDYFSNLCSL